MAEFLKAAAAQDVSLGQGKMVKVGGKHIAPFKVWRSSTGRTQ
jgi:hypothetical protein